jgi:hypothetical protein
MITNYFSDFLFRKAFKVFLIFISFFNVAAAPNDDLWENQNIEPPPAQPIDGYVYVLYLFGIGLMIYQFYKTKKKNAFDKL